MLQSPAYTFSCASCRHPFSYELIHPHFSQRFWKREYRAYVCMQIGRIEASRMPSTMNFVAQKHRARDLKSHIVALQRQYAELSAQQGHIKRSIADLQKAIDDDVRSVAPRYISCGNADCRAYVSYSEPTCIVCRTTTCHMCHDRIVDGAPHVCDDAVVRTISTIRTECRECPTCHAPIQKIDGCDQMYCTRCDSPFSWTTGRIITGAFHNPHLVARREREHGEERCGGLPARHVVSLLLTTHCKPSITSWVMGMYDLIARFRRVEFYKLLNSRIDFNTHLQSRIAIIEHEQTESACVKKWYKVEQHIRLNIELRDVMASYLYNMEGFYQQACSEHYASNSSATMVHWILVGPVKVLTARYIDFFASTYERHFVSSRRLVRQLQRHHQSFPHARIQTDVDDLL